MLLHSYVGRPSVGGESLWTGGRSVLRVQATALLQQVRSLHMVNRALGVPLQDRSFHHHHSLTQDTQVGTLSLAQKRVRACAWTAD